MNIINNGKVGCIMLRVYFGDMKNSVYTPDIYFNNTYEEEWFDDEFVKEMVKDVDKSTVVGRNCINSPFLGQIPPVTLSGGVKALILMYKDTERVFNASKCGDNCAKWILKIAELKQKEGKDLMINLRHIMYFEEEPFEILVENTKQVVHNMSDLITVANNLLAQMGRD